MSTVIKVILLILLLGLLAFVLGPCIYFNFIEKPEGQLDIPNPDKAAYSVYIKNTSGMLLTNDYEQEGNQVGSRVYTLHGFWEVSGKKFVYKKTDVILDEAVFGEISIRRRK